MNREEAINYMKQSVDVKDWNKRRAKVLASFENNDIVERVITIPKYAGNNKGFHEIVWATRIPAWFHRDIEGSGLIYEVLGKENVGGEIVHTTILVDEMKGNG